MTSNIVCHVIVCDPSLKPMLSCVFCKTGKTFRSWYDFCSSLYYLGARTQKQATQAAHVTWGAFCSSLYTRCFSSNLSVRPRFALWRYFILFCIFDCPISIPTPFQYLPLQKLFVQTVNFYISCCVIVCNLSLKICMYPRNSRRAASITTYNFIFSRGLHNLCRDAVWSYRKHMDGRCVPKLTEWL